MADRADQRRSGADLVERPARLRGRWTTVPADGCAALRATVLHAYDTRCAVCALRHVELLDAAHIVSDREEAGIAAVRNGLALCKIHHAAFDSSVLGIRPDLVVEIRSDVLNEIDGPMLEHGLKGRHRQPLMGGAHGASGRAGPHAVGPALRAIPISWVRSRILSSPSRAGWYGVQKEAPEQGRALAAVADSRSRNLHSG